MINPPPELTPEREEHVLEFFQGLDNDGLLNKFDSIYVIDKHGNLVNIVHPDLIARSKGRGYHWYWKGGKPWSLSAKLLSSNAPLKATNVSVHFSPE